MIFVYVGGYLAAFCVDIVRGARGLIRFTLNGQQQTLSVDEGTPLLWVLRDHLAMTGTKFGCGMGLCGACTVHLDGSPIRSCSYPAEFINGREITTIEGLAAADDRLHPVQAARCWAAAWPLVLTLVAVRNQNTRIFRQQICSPMPFCKLAPMAT